MQKPVIGMILGPTASGKTALSVALSKEINAEIISADSIQIYKGMDIGSAKPSKEERAGIKHYLMDEAEPDETGFSVAAYQKKAFEAIEAIRAGHKFPLIVGGTGLYMNALCYPLRFTGVPSEKALRRRLEEEETQRPGSLYEKLLTLDVESAKRLHPNDKKRIIRALEVFELSGKTIGAFGSDFANENGEEIPYEPRMVGLTMPRELLYERINQRVEQMMEAGLLEEVKTLREKGYGQDLPSMQGLGYKQLYAYIEGGYTSLNEAVEAIKLETRHFAKRQMTWFRRDRRICWLDVSAMSFEELLKETKAVMEGRGSGEDAQTK